MQEILIYYIKHKQQQQQNNPFYHCPKIKKYVVSAVLAIALI